MNSIIEAQETLKEEEVKLTIKKFTEEYRELNILEILNWDLIEEILNTK